MAFLHSSNRTWEIRQEGDCRASATGVAFLGGVRLTAGDLATHVLTRRLEGAAFPEIVDGLTGQFAAVLEQGGELWLGSDAIRSVPLFYRADGTAASDSTALLEPGEALDSDSVVEFALMGYVTGPHTLYPDIQTVQGGEVVRLCPGPAERIGYYDYRNTYACDDEGDAVLEALDAAIMAAMGRAVEACAGRQVVIPLSGGLDSRLLAASFKRLGYDKVVCFAYGLPDNWEARKSHAVAEALGWPWFEVPFSGEQLRRDYQSQEMRRYWRFAGQGDTLPFMQEWPALRRITEQGLVEPDAVFLSGQSGDFINGSHLRYLYDPEWRTDSMDVTGAIRAKHCSMWCNLARSPRVAAVLEQRIGEVLDGFPVRTQEQAAAAYEYWECRERQLKYVVPGGRGFEFFGHQWWMPLWDRALIDFFKPVSIGLKMRGYLYAKYLATFDPFGVFQEDRPRARFDRVRAMEAHAARRTPGRRFRAALRSMPLLGPKLAKRGLMREHRCFYRHNPVGFARMYSEREYLHRDVNKRHVLALMLRDYLREAHGVDTDRLEERLDRTP